MKIIQIKKRFFKLKFENVYFSKMIKIRGEFLCAVLLGIKEVACSSHLTICCGRAISPSHCLNGHINIHWGQTVCPCEKPGSAMSALSNPGNPFFRLPWAQLLFLSKMMNLHKLWIRVLSLLNCTTTWLVKIVMMPTWYGCWRWHQP